jgi:hypothetical protein
VRAAIACLVAGIVAAAAATSATAAVGQGAGPPSGNECAGVATCIDVPGPWVAVPAHGEATYLLECPQRRGVVAGVDALASSRDIRVTFDGLLGSPVAPGRTTTAYVFFRAVSAHHRQGLFQPLLGCVPSNTSGAQTTAYRITPAGGALDLSQATLIVTPGRTMREQVGCPATKSLAFSWDATAFGTANPPSISLASDVDVHLVQSGDTARVTIRTSSAMPRSARAEVQIGVACTT